MQNPFVRSGIVTAVVLSIVLGFIPGIIWGVANQNNLQNWNREYNRVTLRAAEVTLEAAPVLGTQVNYHATYSFKTEDGKLVVGWADLTQQQYTFLKAKQDGGQETLVQYDPEDLSNIALNTDGNTIDTQRENINKLRFYLMLLPWMIYGVAVIAIFGICLIIAYLRTAADKANT